MALAFSGGPLHAADLDRDGMDDARELAVARLFSPITVWSPAERCGKHHTLFQVHPLDRSTVLITYVLTFPVDCGFPALGLRVGAHSGDTQELSVVATTPDGLYWEASELRVPNYAPAPLLGRPTVYVSAGKHHLYPSLEACQEGLHGLLEHCGGPKTTEEVAAEDNVGERGHPLIASLSAFADGPWKNGYARETAWGESAWGDQLFCGGDPRRGGSGSLAAVLKNLVGWGACGDSLAQKWH